jgi:Tol biopolymer transport system component
VPSATSRASDVTAGPPSPTATVEPAQNHRHGRIAFGRVVGNDDFYGPFVAIWVVDADGRDLKQLTQGDSGFPAWSPDGKQIAFTQRQADGTWQIATMAPDGGAIKVLTKGFGSDNAAWSPDGTWIAVGTGSAGRTIRTSTRRSGG